MIESVREYLENGFGPLAKCESVQLPASFPLLVSKGYRFYSCEMLGNPFMLAVARDGSVHTPRRVQKELAEVSASFGFPAVYATQRLQPHDKERFIALRQSFVVPGKMVYLPFAGLMQDTSHREMIVNRDVLSSVAQLIVLGVLEHKLLSHVTVQDAVELLMFSAPAVLNAFREIEYFQLAKRRRMVGSRAVELVFEKTGRELWETARPYLSSPVRKIVGLSSRPGKECVVAGVDALAAMGCLNEQPASEFATAKDGFGRLGYEVVSTLGAPVRLQLWAYSPTRLGGNGVDVLSLVLSLAKDRDDRVKIEIDRILEEFKL